MHRPSQRRLSPLSCLALALSMALSMAQNAPSPAPETPVSRYLQVMSATARALQKGQPLYDFKVRPVTGNGMQTLLNDKGSVASCAAPSADNAMCSVVQGLIVMLVVCVVVGFLTFLFWFGFAVARKYCKCCCNNCGGRKPLPEDGKVGGKYSKRSKIIIAVIMFISAAIVIAISSVAISAAYDAPSTLSRFYSAVLDFLDQGTSFLNSANGFVLSNGALIGTAISGVQTSFSALQNTLNSSQINANAHLLQMSASLSFISSSCANFTATGAATACTAKVASFRANIASSTSSLNKFQVKSLALADAASDIAPKLANNTQPTRDAIALGSTFTSNSRKSLLNFQLTSADPEGRAQMGTLLLFGGVWAIPLFFSLAFMCQKWTYWCPPTAAALISHRTQTAMLSAHHKINTAFPFHTRPLPAGTCPTGSASSPPSCSGSFSAACAHPSHQY